MRLEKIFIAGGAGFIGSHFVTHCLSIPTIKRVTVYDNFSSGKKEHLERHQNDPRLVIIKEDIKNLSSLIIAMHDHDCVVHLASNPDIARAATEPTVDFDEGTLLTQHILEALRTTKTKRILYASGSGVYGDLGETEAKENYGPLVPISTYGASKLAGEALIASYCHMFGLTGIAFRFGNVVGPNQTHGVCYDFIRKLQRDSTRLDILGDGSQSKSYVYITDIISAVMLANNTCRQSFDVFNVATGDYITVREIAELVVTHLANNASIASLNFLGGTRGWMGDVPIVRLNTDKIRSLGWCQRYQSKMAITQSIQDLLCL